MKYNDITEYPRPWDKTRFPIVAHITIESERFERMERRIADQTQATILGHDEAGGGFLVVHVACTCEVAKDRIESRWS